MTQDKTLGIALLALVMIATGCRAGFSSRRGLRVAGEGGRVAPGGTIRWDVAEDELEYVIGFSNAGKILLRATRAHGGWEKWRSLIEVRYRRERSKAKPDPESGGDTAPGDGGAFDEATESTSIAAPPVADELVARFDPRGWKETAAEEPWLFSLPFVLLSPDYAMEYLGVEYDVRQDLEFEKVRFSLTPEGEAESSEQVFAFFDLHSGLLKQVLVPHPSGTWWHVRFEGWETIEGLRVATRRRIHVVDGRFRRAGPRSLRWVDRLRDIRLR